MRWWDFNPKLKLVASEISYILYHKTDYPILVSSSGRSGSTMLCHAIMNSSFCSKYRCNFSPRLVFFPAFALNNIKFKKGGVYKSHLLPHRIPDNIKTIFIYDDPVLTYRSFANTLKTYGKSWGIQHLKNLESPYDLTDINHDVDYLNYTNQVKDWMERKKGVFVRLASLWSYREEISEYLGLNLSLPPFKQRASESGKDCAVCKKMDSLIRIYSSLPLFECKP